MVFGSKHGGKINHELSLILLSNLEQEPWKLEVSDGTGVGFLLLIYVDSCLFGGLDHRNRLCKCGSRWWLTWGEEWPLARKGGFCQLT